MNAKQKLHQVHLQEWTSDLLIRKPAALLYASGVSKIIFLFTPITTGSIFSKKKLSVRLGYRPALCPCCFIL